MIEATQKSPCKYYEGTIIVMAAVRISYVMRYDNKTCAALMLSRVTGSDWSYKNDILQHNLINIKLDRSSKMISLYY